MARWRQSPAVPLELRATFHHLFWDIAWMGIVAGSSQAFLGVYAARLGADAFQLGLLSAGPAAVGLIFTLPVGHWLNGRRMGNTVFWAAVWSRLFFVLWLLFPVLLPAATQVWAYVLLVLVMTVPGTVLAVSFNAFYAAAVPPEWRGHVAGRRNAVLALVYVVTSLVSGYILNHTPFTLGYQIIFGLGLVGSALSTYHLWYLRNIATETVTRPEEIRAPINDFARPGDVRMTGMNLRTNIGLRAFTRGVDLLRADVLRGSYGRMLTALFVFHLAQFMPLPVFPLFWVQEMFFTDWEIGLGTAVFYMAVLLGSLPFARLTVRLGHHRLAVVGALLLSFYPLGMALAPGLEFYLFTSFVGGVAWALVGGALGNYLLDHVPPTNRPAYLAWYNLALNAASLLGALAGSYLAASIGLMPALLVAFGLRLFAGYAIWQWR